MPPPINLSGVKQWSADGSWNASARDAAHRDGESRLLTAVRECPVSSWLVSLRWVQKYTHAGEDKGLLCSGPALAPGTQYSVQKVQRLIKFTDI